MTKYLLYNNRHIAITLPKTTTKTQRGSSLFYKTSVWHERHERRECNTKATQMRREWKECDTSATRTTRVRHEWKFLILITTWVKTYFHTHILAIWQIKDYKEKSNFILRTTFWKSLVIMPKCVWKVYHKKWIIVSGSYSS